MLFRSLLAQVDALDAARKELSTAPKKPDTSGFLIRKTRGQDEWTLTKDGKVLGTYGSKKQAEKAEDAARVKKFDEFYEAKKTAAPVANLSEYAAKRIAAIEDAARSKWHQELFNEALQNQLRLLTELYNKGIATDADVAAFEAAIDNSEDSIDRKSTRLNSSH